MHNILCEFIKQNKTKNIKKKNSFIYLHTTTMYNFLYIFDVFVKKRRHLIFILLDSCIFCLFIEKIFNIKILIN